jgi:hypothetical protein
MAVDLISIHVGKCAGRSFLRVLEEVYGRQAVYRDYKTTNHPVSRSDRHVEPDALQDLPAGTRAIHGHFHIDKYADRFPDARRVAWLREPVERLCSHYFFWKTVDPGRLGPYETEIRARNPSLLEFAALPEIVNHVSASYLGTEQLERCSFVGLFEHFEEDLHALAALMGWELPAVPRINATESQEYRRFQLDPGTRAELERLNTADVALYRRALELRARRPATALPGPASPPPRARTAPRERPARDARPPVLIILNDDYGSLGEALYLLRGTDVAATLLSPRRIFATSEQQIEYPLRSFHGTGMLIRQIEELRPLLIIECSAYLYVGAEKQVSLEDFRDLQRYILERGIRLATTDPFLGFWYEFDGVIPPGHPFPGNQKRIVEQYVAVSNELRGLTHLYPYRIDLTADITKICYHSDSLYRSAKQLEDSALRAAEFLGHDRVRPYWMFVVSVTDYKSQHIQYGALFIERLARKIAETISNGRTALLVAPKECIEQLRKLVPDHPDARLLIHCDYNSYMPLLRSAEYVFTWNVLSFSLTERIHNRLPVFFFTKGHIFLLLDGMYEHTRKNVFRDGIIPFLNEDNPLYSEELAEYAGMQETAFFDPYLDAVRSLPAASDVLNRLLNAG